MKTVRNKLRTIIPILHCLLSILYMGVVFKIDNDRSIVLSYAVRNTVSDAAEFSYTFLITYMLGCTAIFLLWKLIFDIFDRKISVNTLRIFVPLFFVGALLLFFVWPESLLHSEDNLVTYSYAIRFLPEYWHSIYSGCVYGAMLLVFPHAISISLLQWLSFVCVLGYAFERINKSPRLSGKGKWTVFLLFLVPDTYLLITDAYRTEQYCILCMFFVTCAVMDAVDEKKRSMPEILGLMPLCALISVWRSEGLILGLLGFGVLILFVYRVKIKPLLAYCVGISLMVLLFMLPQKLGDKKYYGNDYSFINSFVSLQNILNSEDADFSYEGAQKDLVNITMISPLNAIKLLNMEGYRSINFKNGHYDINQSGASLEAGKEYLKSYRNLVLHNPVIFAKTQISMVLKAYGFRDTVYLERDKSNCEMDFEIYEYLAWDIGREDLYSNTFTKNWEQNEVRRAVSKAYWNSHSACLNLLKTVKIYPIGLLIASLGLVYILFAGLINAIRHKTNLAFAGFAFVLLLQYAAIACVMPAGVTAYFHACFYSTFILEAGFVLDRLIKRIGE